MARNSTIRALRTTRANLNIQAAASGLLAGEPYLITDEKRLAVALTTSTYQAYAKQGEGRFYGEMIELAGTQLPPGFVWAYGQTLLVADVPDYAAALGTAYGGNGTTTVGVPDRRGRVSAGKDDMGGTSANRLTGQSGGVNGDNLGATGGAETHTLTISEMPSHDHDIPYNSTNSTANTAALGGSSSVDNNTKKTAAVGGGVAHNNVQPTFIANIAVYVGGIY